MTTGTEIRSKQRQRSGMVRQFGSRPPISFDRIMVALVITLTEHCMYCSRVPPATPGAPPATAALPTRTA